MIDRLRADKELVQRAENVIFRRVTAEASLKSAHAHVFLHLVTVVIYVARLEGLGEVGGSTDRLGPDVPASLA